MRAKFLGKSSTEISQSQLVIYNDLGHMGNGVKKIPSDPNKSSEVNYSLKAENVDLLNCQHDNVCDPLEDTFYTEDVMKQVDEIMKSAEKPNQSKSIEIKLQFHK
ncbi:hypothetical protein Adt_44901 [Abeliophyllum distichum]|uniref:Uncharacterized protein n=1 Tax=Abeliophyllum distichum TaxID=126358 RepID=A0ABD1PC70_9LAMI